ncbi:hypothetical protein CF319_g8402, partial [Tilletia indica]
VEHGAPRSAPYSGTPTPARSAGNLPVEFLLRTPNFSSAKDLAPRSAPAEYGVSGELRSAPVWSGWSSYMKFESSMEVVVPKDEKKEAETLLGSGLGAFFDNPAPSGNPLQHLRPAGMEVLSSCSGEGGTLPKAPTLTGAYESEDDEEMAAMKKQQLFLQVGRIKARQEEESTSTLMHFTREGYLTPTYHSSILQRSSDWSLLKPIPPPLRRTPSTPPAKRRRLIDSSSSTPVTFDDEDASLSSQYKSNPQEDHIYMASQPTPSIRYCPLTPTVAQRGGTFP